MDKHLIGDKLWQRVLEALRREPYMHLTDLGRLRRFVSACFVVLRRNCTWAELGCFVPSAEAAKRRFRRWAKKGVWDRLLQRSQPVAGPDVLHIDSTAIKCHRTATGARGGGEEAIGRSRGGITTKVHHVVDSLGFVRKLLLLPPQEPPQAQPAPGQDRNQLPRLRLPRRSPHEPQAEAETLSLDPNGSEIVDA